MSSKSLPREVNTNTGVLPGYARASELLLPRTDEEVPTVKDLRGALDLFQLRVLCHKIQDVKLEGERIGTLFERVNEKERFLVLFKREPYYHFSRHFPNLPNDKKGYGMLANIKLVHWCALEGIRMAAVMPERKCYVIDGLEFWRFYEEFKTDSPYIQDEIASPFNMWTRIF